MAASQERAPLVRTAEERAEEDAFRSLYGDWQPFTPAEVAAALDGLPCPWWVVGGWAIEAATGYRREHEDIDISILSRDVPIFVDYLKGQWHVWNNVGGVLRPLGDRWPDVDEPESQLWLRVSAASPWVVDVPLTPSDDGLWRNKRLPDHVARIEDVTWVADDGIRYLRPEIVLVYKAALRRPKDDPDFEAALPVLPVERRVWMRQALTSTAPDHPWLDKL